MDRQGALRVALVLVGLILLLGVYPLGIVWPSGWPWGVGASLALFLNFLPGYFWVKPWDGDFEGGSSIR